MLRHAQNSDGSQERHDTHTRHSFRHLTLDSTNTHTQTNVLAAQWHITELPNELKRVNEWYKTKNAQLDTLAGHFGGTDNKKLQEKHTAQCNTITRKSKQNTHHKLTKIPSPFTTLSHETTCMAHSASFFSQHQQQQLLICHWDHNKTTLDKCATDAAKLYSTIYRNNGYVERVKSEVVVSQLVAFTDIQWWSLHRFLPPGILHLHMFTVNHSKITDNTKEWLRNVIRNKSLQANDYIAQIYQVPNSQRKLI